MKDWIRKATAILRTRLSQSSSVTSSEDRSILNFLLRGMSWTALFRVVNLISGFTISVVLARLLGAEDYGIFQYVNSWIALLGVFAGLGLEKIVIREIAAAYSNSNWSEIKGIRRFALFVGTISGVVFAIIGVLLWFSFEKGKNVNVFLIAALRLPLERLVQFLSAVQNGFEQIPAAGFPNMVRDAGFALVLFLVWAVGIPLDAPTQAIGIRVMTVLAAVGFAMYLQISLSKNQGDFFLEAEPTYHPKDWMVAALPLVFLAGTLTLNSNADILMLGQLVSPEVVGPYHAATRGSMLVTFALTALINPLSPVIARLHSNGEHEQLQRMLSKLTRRIFFATLLLALALILGSKWFLSLFGSDFIVAQTALIILIGGRVISVGVGPVQRLLVMSGQERIATAGAMLSTIVNLSLNGLLIPRWGIEGAATATALSIVTWNLLMLWQVKKRLNLSMWG